MRLPVVRSFQLPEPDFWLHRKLEVVGFFASRPHSEACRAVGGRAWPLRASKCLQTQQELNSSRTQRAWEQAHLASVDVAVFLIGK